MHSEVDGEDWKVLIKRNQANSLKNALGEKHICDITKDIKYDIFSFLEFQSNEYRQIMQRENMANDTREASEQFIISKIKKSNTSENCWLLKKKQRQISRPNSPPLTLKIVTISS